MASTLWVEGKITPLSVAGSLFDVTKSRVPRVDWSDFSLNNGNFSNAKWH